MAWGKGQVWVNDDGQDPENIASLMLSTQPGQVGLGSNLRTVGAA